MREIVVGTISPSQGVQFLNVWFRFSVPAARQGYYTSINSSYKPLAPGDYANADIAEVNLFQTGQWVERAGFQDVIDPTDTLTAVQTRLQNLYSAADTAFINTDNAGLAHWDSSWDGTTWTNKAS